jgi:hypothetical protein
MIHAVFSSCKMISKTISPEDRQLPGNCPSMTRVHSPTESTVQTQIIAFPPPNVNGKGDPATTIIASFPVSGISRDGYNSIRLFWSLGL